MCHALLLFMGNAISGGGGSGGVGSRKTTESARSGVSDLKMTATTGTSAIVNELTRDVERLKMAMDEKDRTIEQLGRAVEDIRNMLENAVSNQFLVPSSQSSQLRLDKKKGVSGECSTSSETPIPFPKQSKPIKTKHLIKQALCKNQFLKNLNTNQISEIVDVMYPKDFEAGAYVIRKGDPGCCLYVADEGKFDVIQSGRVVDSIGPGEVFGEMAILYNCPRTASVRAIQDVRVWTLERVAYQQIMKTSAMRRFDERVGFLKSVPLMKDLNEEFLSKIADVLKEEFYPEGHYIIKQDTLGDKFYILSEGRVKVTKTNKGEDEEEEFGILEQGEFFGEVALLKKDKRTANVVAMHPGAECLTLDREPFVHFIGNLEELKNKKYTEHPRKPSVQSSVESKTKTFYPELFRVELTDFETVATIGVGGFGRVDLVCLKLDKNRSYAMKKLKKQQIVDMQQQEHVYNEKTILESCTSPFIGKLYKTYKDKRYVYMLMEACLGGEVWTLLRDRRCFDDNAACFVIACVVEALDYLHGADVVYRDLKPENLLLDRQGFVKLVDFGFAKKLQPRGKKTWTFCGTPEYVAPEVVLNKGHDRAVDFWALGILVYELLAGIPPFSGKEPMDIYNAILKGIGAVNFPRQMNKMTQGLVKQLCRSDPTERIGYQKGGIQDIRRHEWFKGFDWIGLRNKNIIPPIVPHINNPLDSSNFDIYPEDGDMPPDELSGWDSEF
ncbi:cGMP-dependent protein kinase, isozyme 1-like [Rhopalosiphum padi]|uniref:cGMP-dependent protein kinase, isozyme 1-like n=1 Tax=Rhopalosiphum padi TaxID=40932 RepID=UPI00298E1FFF|nr:cGMP-dependent protein kinase, isozyme 1-like [Rhopalosiphum padi]XP_060851769.1 cGMP-dependent protein kinase, isozyme 1-like [Rhopalosiphum padi]